MKAQSILHYQVIRYDCDINLDSDRIPDPDSLTKNMMPESITYFTPVIESDKKVLYVSPEVETILAGYIEEGRKSSPEEFQKRENTIGELIPMTIAHWDDGWFFLSYPNIHEIVITNNGYYIDLADTYFVAAFLLAFLPSFLHSFIHSFIPAGFVDLPEPNLCLDLCPAPLCHQMPVPCHKSQQTKKAIILTPPL